MPRKKIKKITFHIVKKGRLIMKGEGVKNFRAP